MYSARSVQKRRKRGEWIFAIACKRIKRKLLRSPTVIPRVLTKNIYERRTSNFVFKNAKPERDQREWIVPTCKRQDRPGFTLLGSRRTSGVVSVRAPWVWPRTAQDPRPGSAAPRAPPPHLALTVAQVYRRASKSSGNVMAAGSMCTTPLMVGSTT